MKDLIRSPLQFVRPMTDHEWEDLVSRASHRERQRIKRHQSRDKLAAPEPAGRRHHSLERDFARTDASATL